MGVMQKDVNTILTYYDLIKEIKKTSEQLLTMHT